MGGDMLRLQHVISKDLSLRSFIIAGAIMAVAVAARAAIDFVLPNTPPFITLYPAVALAGLLCGPFAASITGLMGLLAAIFVWIPPRMSFGWPNLTDRFLDLIFQVRIGNNWIDAHEITLCRAMQRHSS